MAQPALALSLLQDLGLAQAVYAPPEHVTPAPPEEGYDWARGVAAVQAVARVLAYRTSLQEAGRPGLEEQIASGEESGKNGSGHPPVGSAGPAIGVGVATTVGSTIGLEGGERGYSMGAASNGKEQELEKVGTVAGVAAPPAVMAADADMDMATDREGVHGSVAPVQEANIDGAHKGQAKGKGKDKTALDNSNKGANVAMDDKEGSGGGEKVGEPQSLVRELFLSAALLPLAGVQHKIKKGKFVPATQSVVQESLKVTKRSMQMYCRDSKFVMEWEGECQCLLRVLCR